jgi:hypothetical protein
MNKRIVLAATLAMFALSGNAYAKSISLSELQSSQANFKPAVNITARDFNSDHWAYKSLEGITRKYGLIVGNAGEKFDGSKPLTRNEAAVILVNLIGKVEQDRISLDASEKTQIDILKNELDQDIAALTGRVATLEKRTDALQASVTKVETNDSLNLKTTYGKNMKLSGAVQGRYNGIFAGRDGGDPTTSQPNFSIPYSDLMLTGKIAKHVSYTTVLLPSATWNNTTATAIGPTTRNTVGSILYDAFVSTDIVPHHTIVFGQTRTPIGVEGTISSRLLDTIDRAQISRNFSNGRDVGFKVTGNWPMVDYYLGVFNGSGMTYRDNSKEMAFGGWVTAKPLYKLPQYGKLEIGGGYYRAKAGNASNASFIADNFRYQTIGANIAYKYKKVGMKTELAMKRGGTPTTGTVDIPVGRGMFTQLSYDLTKKLQVLARYDIFEQNQLLNRRDNTEYTLGANYFLAPNVKFQLNAVHVTSDNVRDSNRIMALTQYVF